jgi:hypothetical protein
MKTPPVTTPTDELQTLHTYLVARLKAAKAHSALVRSLDAAAFGLERAEQHHEACLGAMVTAMALRDAADGAADDLVQRFYQGLSEARRSAKLRKHYFPHGLVSVVMGAIGDQPQEMRVLVGLLDDEESESLAAFSPLLEQKAEVLEDAVDAYIIGLDQTEAAYGTMLAARAQWLRAYSKTYAALAAELGKRKADGFFKKHIPTRKPTRKKPARKKPARKKPTSKAAKKATTRKR